MPIGLLIRAGLVVAAFAAVVGGLYAIKRHYIEEGRAEVRAQWDAHELSETAATAAQDARWREEVIKTEAAIGERDEERRARFAAIAETRRLADEVARLPLHRDVVERVLSAISAANRPAIAARPAAVTPAPGPAAAGAQDRPAESRDADPGPPVGSSDMGLLVEWVDATAQQYAACRDQVAGWIAFYAALQRAQQELPHE